MNFNCSSGMNWSLARDRNEVSANKQIIFLILRPLNFAPHPKTSLQLANVLQQRLHLPLVLRLQVTELRLHLGVLRPDAFQLAANAKIAILYKPE
jgi:hypothetical protein